MALQKLFIGKQIRLTALQQSDLETIAHWYHDSDFIRLYDGTVAAPRNREHWQKWYDDLNKSVNAYQFAIRLLDDKAIIGLIGLDGIIWNQGVSGVGIAIGDPIQRGKGYGHEAMQLILQFAFHECNLHRVQLSVFSYNTAAIKLYERLGFIKEGVYREFILRDGMRHDMLLYSMLRHEWEAQSQNG